MKLINWRKTTRAGNSAATEVQGSRIRETKGDASARSMLSVSQVKKRKFHLTKRCAQSLTVYLNWGAPGMVSIFGPQPQTEN
jgi:hypothetical protein